MLNVGWTISIFKSRKGLSSAFRLFQQHPLPRAHVPSEVLLPLQPKLSLDSLRMTSGGWPQVTGQWSRYTELINMICRVLYIPPSSWSCSHAACSCLTTASPPRAPSSAETFPAPSVAGTTTRPPCPGRWWSACRKSVSSAPGISTRSHCRSSPSRSPSPSWRKVGFSFLYLIRSQLKITIITTHGEEHTPTHTQCEHHMAWCRKDGSESYNEKQNVTLWKNNNADGFIG